MEAAHSREEGQGVDQGVDPGEDPEAGVKCARARCAYTCEGVAAVCSSEGRCELSEQGEEKKEVLL